MAQEPHPRVITNEQFADVTTIDGDRLDRASADVESAINSVPARLVGTMWVPTTYVMGWCSSDIGTTSPFLQGENLDATDVVTSGTVPDPFNNKHRVKGYQKYAGEDIDNWWIWTTALYFSRPAILWDLTLWAMADHPTIGSRLHTMDHKYLGPGTPTVGGQTIADDAHDWSIVVHTDSPFSPEDRGTNAVNIARHDFVINRDAVAEWDWGAASAEGQTGAPPGGPLHGSVIKIPCDEPIPPRSRVRAALILPEYTAAVETLGGATPWSENYFTMNLTVLELLRER